MLRYPRCDFNQELEFVHEKGERIRGYQKKNREGSFGCPPLAEFGADAARSFADQTTDGRGWHWREVAAGPLALEKQKVVSGVY